MSTNVTIKRWVFSPATSTNPNPSKAGQQAVASNIPITSACKYVCELMTDEYVVLQWNSDKRIDLQVGDFIDQVGSTIYYIRELATPTRNSNGGYTYEQKFEAEWKFWQNWKLLYKRGIAPESGWKMTQFPSYFLDLIKSTINENKWKFGEYTYQIDGTFPEMKLCDFSDGTDLISALNTMCDDDHWRTEWWVDNVNRVLHFGACISENTVSLDESHTKSVTRSQSQNGNGINKLFAFGGTRNISNRYRKDLVFTVEEDTEQTLTGVRTSKGTYNTAVIDAKRLLTYKCLDYVGTPTTSYDVEGMTGSVTIEPHYKKTASFRYKWTTEILLNNTARVCQITGGLLLNVKSSTSSPFSGYVYFYLVDAQDKQCSEKKSMYVSGAINTNVNFAISIGNLQSYKDISSCKLCMECSSIANSGGDLQSVTVSTSNVKVKLLGSDASYKTRIVIHNRTYDAVINPTNATDGVGRYAIAYNKDNSDTEAIVGDTFTLLDVKKYLVPASFFTAKNDDAVKAGVAENRLMLPEGITDIQSDEVTIYNEKEGILILDDIYPKMDVSVTQVVTEPEQTTDESTGVVEKWNAYRIKYTGFPFSDKYILDGETLHIVFQSGNLCGMDFEVEYKGENVFEIVRNNEDYGTPIPNDNMKPAAGDKFVLYGWNTDYIDEALVPQAEQQLLQKATEVLEEMQKDQSTYDLEMNVIRCMGYKVTNQKLNLTDAGAMSLALGQKVEYTNSIYGEASGTQRKVTARVRRIEKGLDGLSLRYQLGVSAPYSRSRELRSLINNIK